MGLLGSGDKEVYGTVLINETNQDGAAYRKDVVQGTSAIHFSRSALAIARQLVPAATVSSLMSTLPTSVRQTSWREVSS